MRSPSNLQPIPGSATSRGVKLTERTLFMHETAMLLLALASLAAATPMLTARYTAQRAGKDLSTAGNSSTHSAEKNTNYGR